jgi:hypothetical protein
LRNRSPIQAGNVSARSKRIYIPRCIHGTLKMAILGTKNEAISIPPSLSAYLKLLRNMNDFVQMEHGTRRVSLRDLP